jgi:hypothetical protein
LAYRSQHKPARQKSGLSRSISRFSLQITPWFKHDQEQEIQVESMSLFYAKPGVWFESKVFSAAIPAGNSDRWVSTAPRTRPGVKIDNAKPFREDTCHRFGEPQLFQG